MVKEVLQQLEQPKLIQHHRFNKSGFIYDGCDTIFKHTKSLFDDNGFWDEYVNLSDLEGKAVFSFDYKVGEYIPLKKVRHLFKLANCGKWGKVNIHCKGCREAHRDSLMKTTYKQISCGSRYCSCPDCMSARFASTLEQFNSIQDLKSLRKLQHWTIGFERVSFDYFRKNWRKMKKDFEYTMNVYWARLKKAGVELKGIRVLDFAFDLDFENGTVYPHYHFGLKPFRMGSAGQNMRIIAKVRKGLLGGRSKRVQHFFFKRHGKAPKKKSAILSYLAKRSAGLYKKDEGKNLKWDSGFGALRKAIDQKKYYSLSDFMDLDQYLDLFHGTRHFTTVGGLPRGSKPMDNIKDSLPKYCPFCDKELTRHDLYIHTIIGCDPPPEFAEKQGRDQYVLMRGNF